MAEHNTGMTSTLVRALAVAVILAVAIPACGMAFCAMDMSMGSMLTCEGMGVASDAASGVLAGIVFFSLLAIAAVLTVVRMHAEGVSLMAVADAPPPRPPTDPLMGRLII